MLSGTLDIKLQKQALGPSESLARQATSHPAFVPSARPCWSICSEATAIEVIESNSNYYYYYSQTRIVTTYKGFNRAGS